MSGLRTDGRAARATRHVVVLDGAYVEEVSGAPRFESARTPTESDMAFVSRAVAHGMGGIAG